MKNRVKQLIERTGFQISRRPRTNSEAVYDRDGLRTAHDHGFMKTPRFQAAYQRGVRAAGEDYKWEWRVHVGLWAAETASRVPGDFVECGVNRGFMSSAIMHDLDWNQQN